MTDYPAFSALMRDIEALHNKHQIIFSLLFALIFIVVSAGLRMAFISSAAVAELKRLGKQRAESDLRKYLEQKGR